jgi:hypothetical protein
LPHLLRIKSPKSAKRSITVSPKLTLVWSLRPTRMVCANSRTAWVSGLSPVIGIGVPVSLRMSAPTGNLMSVHRHILIDQNIPIKGNGERELVAA